MSYKCHKCDGYGSVRGHICHVCRGTGIDPVVWVVTFLIVLFCIMYGLAGLVNAVTQTVVYQYAR